MVAFVSPRIKQESHNFFDKRIITLRDVCLASCSLWIYALGLAFSDIKRGRTRPPSHSGDFIPPDPWREKEKNKDVRKSIKRSFPGILSQAGPVRPYYPLTSLPGQFDFPTRQKYKTVAFKAAAMLSLCKACQGKINQDRTRQKHVAPQPLTLDLTSYEE